MNNYAYNLRSDTTTIINKTMDANDWCKLTYLSMAFDTVSVSPHWVPLINLFDTDFFLCALPIDLICIGKCGFLCWQSHQSTHICICLCRVQGASRRVTRKSIKSFSSPQPKSCQWRHGTESVAALARAAASRWKVFFVVVGLGWCLLWYHLKSRLHLLTAFVSPNN